MTPKRILLVEDEAITAWDEKEVLEGLGYSVTAVVNIRKLEHEFEIERDAAATCPRSRVIVLCTAACDDAERGT